eukprot:g9326.t1
MGGVRRKPIDHEAIESQLSDAARSANNFETAARDGGRRHNLYSQHMARFAFDHGYATADGHYHYQQGPGAIANAEDSSAAAGGSSLGKERKALAEAQKLALVSREVELRREMRTQYKVLPRVFDAWAQIFFDNLQVDYNVATQMRLSVLRRAFKRWAAEVEGDEDE